MLLYVTDVMDFTFITYGEKLQKKSLDTQYKGFRALGISGWTLTPNNEITIVVYFLFLIFYIT